MKWHVDVAHHPNQFGFAITVCYISMEQLPDSGISFACNHCGADAPQVIFELSLLVWTLFVMAHAKVEQ